MDKRFAFFDLKPKKGKFLFHVLGSTIALFIIVFLYMWADYGKILTLIQALKLMGQIFLLALVIWSGAYLFKALISRDKKSQGDH